MRLIDTKASADWVIASGKNKVITSLMLLNSDIVTKTYSREMIASHAIWLEKTSSK